MARVHQRRSGPAPRHRQKRACHRRRARLFRPTHPTPGSHSQKVRQLIYLTNNYFFFKLIIQLII